MKRTRSEGDRQTDVVKEPKLSEDDSGLAELKAKITTAVDNDKFEEAFRLTSQAFVLKGTSEFVSVVKGQSKQDTALDMDDSIEAILNFSLHFPLQINVARIQHLTGALDKAGTPLRFARKNALELQATSRYMIRQIEKVMTDCHLSLVHLLPNELLLDIFVQLGTVDLLSCWRTNRRWNDLTQPILKERTPHLSGSIDKIDSAYKRYGMMMQHAGIVSLSVGVYESECTTTIGHYRKGALDTASNIRRAEYDEELMGRWCNTRLIKNFPHKTLERFFYSSFNYVFDSATWECVTQCEKLKSLVWRTIGEIDYDRDFRHKMAEYRVAGTPLAKCVLDKIDLEGYESDRDEFTYDEAFEKLCERAKYCRVRPKCGIKDRIPSKEDATADVIEPDEEESDQDQSDDN